MAGASTRANSSSGRAFALSRPLYHLFGLTVASDLPLPLTAANGPAAVDVVLGPVAAAGDLIWRDNPPFAFACFRDGAAVILAWPEARFRVTPDRVVVEAVNQEAAADLLVPAVWSVMMSLRGREALHACAAEQNGRAIAILGSSGFGKSTAGRLLLDRGWRLVTDDLLAFDETGQVLPGPPFLRLAPDSAGERAGEIDTDGKRRVSVPVSPAPAPVAAMVVLAEGYGSCVRLSGLPAVTALLGQVYDPLPIHPDQRQRHLRLAAGLASRVPIYGAAPRSLTAVLLERLVAEADA